MQTKIGENETANHRYETEEEENRPPGMQQVKSCNDSDTSYWKEDLEDDYYLLPVVVL